jgi:chemotaxis protein MotA
VSTYNWMGVVLFTGIYGATFLFTDNAGLMLNGIGLSVVLSGTLGAMFLSYPVEDIRAALRVAHNTYAGKMFTPERIIAVLRELAVRTRTKGVLALEDFGEHTTIGFLKRGLNLLVDGFNDDELHDILQTEMFYFKQRRIQHERVFRHAARLAPAFGVAGSVIGLIAMLAGIGDPDVILRSIPVALTSTLYGIVLSNFILTPIAESIHAKTERELLLQKLVTDGVIAIRREPNPVRLATKLESFLTPAARHHENRSVDELRDRIRELHSQV